MRKASSSLRDMDAPNRSPAAAASAPVAALVMVASGVSSVAHTLLGGAADGMTYMYVAPLPPSTPGAPTAMWEPSELMETDSPNLSPLAASAAGRVSLTALVAAAHAPEGLVNTYTEPLPLSSPGAPTATWVLPALRSTA